MTPRFKFQPFLTTERVSNSYNPLKANSQMPCRAHALPLPCRAALIYLCHAGPLPLSDNAVYFVKVRVVAGNIETASPTV
jgi:hypothetical protein